MLPATVSIYSTCPESRSIDRAAYVERVRDAARWSEAAGCEGILVYSENGLVDAWSVAQLVVLATERLEPLVAVQPAYQHPYATAKLVATFAHLHDRRTQLNLVAGGFRNDLRSLGDETPHDQRYERLREYGEIVRDLTAGAAPITRSSRWYSVEDLRLQPAIRPELEPRLMVSGSSPAGLACAQHLGATAVRYPRPSGEDEPPAVSSLRQGIRIGVILGEDREDAWNRARERFPEDRGGQITHRLAMSVSDSQWHRQLSRLALDSPAPERPYWLSPFQNSSTFCPYLVGDEATVTAELAGYLRTGVDTVILDIPASRDELERSVAVVGAAAARAG